MNSVKGLEVVNEVCLNINPLWRQKGQEGCSLSHQKFITYMLYNEYLHFSTQFHIDMYETCARE